jgi:hypothetical protein
MLLLLAAAALAPADSGHAPEMARLDIDHTIG